MIEKLYLIARVGDTRIALRSAEVESVVVVRTVTPVPGAPPHIIGLFALRSRVVTLVDAGAAAGDAPIGLPDACKAIIVEHGGHAYGIVVDQVEDIMVIDCDEIPVRGRLSAGWDHVTDAMIDHEGATLLVVDGTALVGGYRAKAA